ncbi:hypothetical protein FHETE_2206 [Fusarium heterosporum]|uniref:Uncharacterized protein n=1 Tax=Fusarium heterosporum TaxID=42747 RepID=A0A8H5TV57_FUSHE|nr:hypothetical protein FHETE_2206 [Fusarium heterosporum]
MEESAPKRRRTSPLTSLEVGATEVPASPQRRHPSYASPTKASLARNNPEAFERRRSRSPQKLPGARPSAQFTFDSPSEALAARLATSRIVSDAPTPTRPNEAPTEDADFNPFRGRVLRRSTEAEDESFNPFRGKVLRRSTEAEDESFNPFRGKVLRRSLEVDDPMDTDAPSASMPELELPSAIQASSPPVPPASMPEPRPEPPRNDPVVELQDDTRVPSEEPTPAKETSPVKSTSPAPSPSPARSFSSFEMAIPGRSSSPIMSPLPAESSVAQAPEPVQEQEQEPESESESQLEQEPESLLAPEEEPEPEPERDSPPPLPAFSPSPPPASMPPPSIPSLAQHNSQDAVPSASQPVPRLPALDQGPRKSFQNSPVRIRGFSQQRDSPLAKPPSRLLEKPRKNFNPDASTLKETKPVKATSGARQPRAFDPDAEKKKELERVQKEIQSLQKDLEIARKENERIRLMQQSGRVLTLANQDEVIDLIQRHIISPSTEPSPTPSQQLLQAVLNPAALLPFSKIITPVPQKPVEDKQAEIKSHYPVSLTAEEELPYLELFTPFSISSNISVLPEVEGEPLRQLHAITFRSREIPGIFTARVNMTVNASELTVLDLDVTTLEPAAKSELGPFVQKICTGDCNRSMQRNVGILSWAMGEWLRVAVERAGFWCQLEQNFGSKDGVSQAAVQMRTRKSRKRKDDEDDADEPTKLESVKKADLIRYMGRQHFDISIPNNDAEDSGASVRLEWKTEFDWTGEAQNKLCVLVGAPGKCEYMSISTGLFTDNTLQGIKQMNEDHLARYPNFSTNLYMVKEKRNGLYEQL